MPGLHSHVLDFEILETGNTKTLIFVDSSQYMEEPERPLLEIILPGFKKYFLVNVDARHVNTFNSSTIGLNQVYLQEQLVDLPDGVWTFKYKICPYKFVYVTKTKMRVTHLLKKLDSLYRQIDLRECSGKEDFEQQRTLVRIHILIEGAKAEAPKNPKLASEYYHLADKLVQKELDKLCKNCK